MDRRRLEVQWRAAAALAGVSAVLAALALLAPVWLDRVGWWITAVFGLLAGGMAVVLVRTRARPFEYRPSLRHADARAAAVAEVRAGRPVEPPELEASALEEARRNYWALTMQAGTYPLLGATWMMNATGGWLGFVPVAGVVAIAAGIVILAVVRRRIHHLDAVEDLRARTPAPTTIL